MEKLKEKAKKLVEHIAVNHTRGTLEDCAGRLYSNVSRISRTDLETIVYIMLLFDIQKDKRYTVIADGEVLMKNTSGKTVIDFIRNRCAFKWWDGEVKPRYYYNGKGLDITIKEVQEEGGKS